MLNTKESNCNHNQLKNEQYSLQLSLFLQGLNTQYYENNLIRIFSIPILH